MISRRTILKFSGATLALGATRSHTATVMTDATQQALQKSDVIYITPLKKSGAESTCHAEVWFAMDDGDVCVVTSAKAWRARAISLGLTHARMWVGEFGTWKRAAQAYRKAPELLAAGALVRDAATQVRVLAAFGAKYNVEWLVWGPRFQKGLKDGSRVMLRYTPLPA